MNAQETTDELLRPSLAEHRPRGDSAKRPWRLGSQVYVAFFGGPLAVTAVALLNAGRLRMRNGERARILAAGLLGVAGILTYGVAVVADDPSGSAHRVVMALISLAAWGPMFLVQRPWDRIYQAFSDAPEDEDYESLVITGLLAVVLGLLVQVSLLAAVGAS